ncbi:MAG: hypothetical protein K8I02_02260, partial [Candidatus Methylomirabilis sp.]|nr:hypothetical protein [Deltaproteobacteria bacterium]
VPHCGDRPKPSVPLCASAAQGGGHALWLPGVGTEFIFTAPGPFIEKGDGTAQLSGVVVDANDTNRRFTVKLDFGGRVNPGDAGYPPAGSPKKELPASQYAPVGPVNPNTWHYYTTLTGALAGDRDLEGALYTVARRGPAFQVGVGANGKNIMNGASGWFTATLVQQPYVGDALPGTVHGDVNVDLSAECEYCVQGALLDGALNQAFWLPGISEYFLFVPPGTFVEHADGTAELDGVIIDVSDPTLTRRFAVHVVFSGRVNPGEAGYPPPDSPHTGLLETGDLVPAGPVDTDSWHYYTVIQGTLTGLGAFDGAVLTFDRRGPAYQVGPGGSGFNHDFGSGGWITLDVISQPTSGDPLPDGVEGDINLDHDVECVPEGGTG